MLQDKSREVWKILVWREESLLNESPNRSVCPTRPVILLYAGETQSL